MRYKEAMPPSKKMAKPAAKVKQRKYAEDKEKYDYDEKVKEGKKNPGKPVGISQALDMSKEGYSKKPRVQPSKKRK